MQFKAESARLLDLMINSIYTHQEIFLREIISNASDACDKLCYLSLTDDSVKTKRSDYRITVSVDKDERTLTVSDNGKGMGDGNGMGLQNIRERIEPYHGTLRIVSGENEGTEINLTLPL